MAQQVDVHVQIGSVEIKHFLYLHVGQDMHTHHTFELVVPFENVEDKNQFFFKGAHQALIGKGATISFTPRAKNVSADFNFLGIVTELSLNNDSEMVNSYIIRGHSPTILMEDGQQRRAWVTGRLGSIMGTVANDYAGNLLKFNIAPAYQALIDYKVQYDETNWQFINRLAAEYGEWCYYDGQVFTIGKPGAAVQDFVIDGVQHFEMSVSIKPNKYQFHHYNYQQHKTFDSPHSPAGGFGPLGDFAYQQSQTLFANAAQILPLKDVGSAGELDGHRATANAMNGTDLVRFNGRGENPNLTIGMTVAVTGQKLIKPGQYKQESVGNYRLISVDHYVDEEGNYQNRFVAVPASADRPPYNDSVRQPISLPEVATVIANDDPQKLGRVKVQFHWPNRLAGKSSWIRVAMAYTGGPRGSLFIPELDDQVMITYEANHVDFPVVVGSLYHKDPSTNYAFPNNEQKIIRTKGGNKIVMKDKPGEQEFFITNANKKGTGIHISFKDEGVIQIYTEGLVKVDAKNIDMHARENIVLYAEKDVMITADQQLLLHGQTKTNVTGDEFNVKSNSKVDITGPNVDVYE